MEQEEQSQVAANVGAEKGAKTLEAIQLHKFFLPANEK